MTGDFELKSATALRAFTALKVEKLLRDQTAEIERLRVENEQMLTLLGEAVTGLDEYWVTTVEGSTLVDKITALQTAAAIKGEQQ